MPKFSPFEQWQDQALAKALYGSQLVAQYGGHQAIWADFNGRNHAELAAKYGISVRQVYTALSLHARYLSELDLIKAVEAVVAVPEHYQALPASLRNVVVRAVRDRVGLDAAVKLQSLHSDVPPTGDERPHVRPASQTVEPARQSPVRRAFRLASDFVQSLFASH